MAFWCYILRCADGKCYTGHTDDLERRIAEHHQGGYCDFTSRRLPVTLIWASDFPTRYEALSAELKIKKWSRAKKEALAASDWKRLSFFAKPPRERVSTSLDTNGGGENGGGEEDPEFRSGRTEVGDELENRPVRVPRDRNEDGIVFENPSVRVERSRDTPAERTN